jgi:hypothetical protein
MNLEPQDRLELEVMAVVLSVITILAFIAIAELI